MVLLSKEKGERSMKFFYSNETKFRLLRTICQGIIGVLIANVDALIGQLTIAPEYKPMIVALVMAILSPIMAEIGKGNDVPDIKDGK